MSFFKDISNTLARKYPDRKVFVISDQHFDHKNIINHTRADLFGSKEDSLNEMNKHIISKHNEVVGEDDIVIILGDFSFKTGIERLKELTTRLNGHKFLVMGNHDTIDKPDLYLRAGFEDIFLSPVKFNGDYYSHYPLNASIDSGERPDTVLYKFLCEEFKNADSGINFHGHQHTLVNNGEREKNVSCEQVDYRPILVGRTKSYLGLTENNLPYLGEEFFEILHKIMSKYNHFQENGMVTDYLYTILLEILSQYEDKIVTFGSVMLNKKYNTNFNPSDLDVTRLFDKTKSIRSNRNSFKEFGNEVYEKMTQIEGINPDFYKKIDFICILSFIYATKNSRFKGYLDMNIFLDEFYKSEDFIKESGKSLLEECTNKLGIDNPKTIRYPKFNVQTTNAFADLVNSFLQYIYSIDNEKKILALKKMHKIMEKTDISSQIDIDKLQNMVIRYLLRNIYFYESCRRKKDSDIVLLKRDIEVPEFVGVNKSFGDALKIIVSDKEYFNVLDSINNSQNRRQEITKILKHFK